MLVGSQPLTLKDKNNAIQGYYHKPYTQNWVTGLLIVSSPTNALTDRKGYGYNERGGRVVASEGFWGGLDDLI